MAKMLRKGAKVCVTKLLGQKYQTFPGAEGEVLGRHDGLWRVRMRDTGHILLFRAAELCMIRGHCHDGVGSIQALSWWWRHYGNLLLTAIEVGGKVRQIHARPGQGDVLRTGSA